jgi:toxin ParE1/3/4
LTILRVHEAATEEAAEATQWYEDERPGLGVQFEAALDSALDLIEEGIVPLTPVQGEAGGAGLQRLVLRRFPFSIIAHVDDEEIVVIAFAHDARRPGYWRERLST